MMMTHRQMDLRGRFLFAEHQLLGDGCQRKEVIILALGLVLLERLAAAAHHIEFAAVFQNIFLGVGFMFVCHKPGGK